MNIRDIVNKEVASITNCESEPIHIPGSIQPHGFLIGLTKNTLLIDYVSGNCSQFLQLTPEQLIGSQFDKLLPQDSIASFKQFLSDSSADISKPFVFIYDNAYYNTTIHESGNTVILEFEPFPDGSMNVPELYSQTRKFVLFIQQTHNLRELCQVISEETRAITGYDRVMIYRFDKDYNGEVFAESKREDLLPFLGHHYPHTDIPVQARELYLRNLMRMIVDVDFEPVPLFTADDRTDKALDLSLSVLRSVSPIHIQYLKNMGVKATLTISLIENKRLWGLITCHHYSARNIPHYTRLSALLQGHFLTSQIKVREIADEYDMAKTAEMHLNDLMRQVNGDNIVNDVFNNPLLLALTQADGVAIVTQTAVYSQGITPTQEQTKALAKFLEQYAKTGSYITSKLVDIYPEAAKFAENAAGIIYHSLGFASRECIIWFRREMEKAIYWAGNPAKGIVQDKSTGRLSPRTSFELWKEEVKFQSQEWCTPHINVAANFSHALQKQISLFYITREEEKSRNMAEKLQAANDELSNFNWISAHDLKEPLRKMQIFSSKLLDGNKYNLPEAVSGSIDRIRSSANRMQNLLDDMLVYSRTAKDGQHHREVDMNLVLTHVLQELADDIREKSASITSQKLPVIQGIEFQMHHFQIAGM